MVAEKALKLVRDNGLDNGKMELLKTIEMLMEGLWCKNFRKLITEDF